MVLKTGLAFLVIQLDTTECLKITERTGNSSSWVFIGRCRGMRPCLTGKPHAAVQSEYHLQHVVDHRHHVTFAAHLP